MWLGITSNAGDEKISKYNYIKILTIILLVVVPHLWIMTMWICDDKLHKTCHLKFFQIFYLFKIQFS